MRNSRILMLAGTGLLIISLLSQGRPPREDIGEISGTDIGEKIQLNGEIEDFSSYNSSNFINISDETGSITAVSFNSPKRFSEGEKVLVEGEVTMYHGKLELVADRVSRTGLS